MTRVKVQPAPETQVVDDVSDKEASRRPTPPKKDHATRDNNALKEEPHAPLQNKAEQGKQAQGNNALKESEKLPPPPRKEGSKRGTKTSTKSRVVTPGDEDAVGVDVEEEGSPSSTCFTMCDSFKGHWPRLYFLVIIVLDVADLISDWLLYADVSMAEDGLVYGALNRAVVHSLLAFSIIGVFTFLFEGVNLWYEVFRDNPWLDSEIVAAFTIWIEDLPQIGINVYIAWCREDPISIFQLLKATVILLSLVVRIVISCARYCNKPALREANPYTTMSRVHIATRFFIFFGLLINAACAIAVFIFTQTDRDPNGGIRFLVPKTLFEEEYNGRRYFQNVSVFLHHPEFDANAASQGSDSPINWMRVMPLEDIRGKKDLRIGYNFVYEKRPNDLKMALFVKKETQGTRGSWRVSKCYAMTLGTGQVAEVTSATCRSPSFFSAQAKSVYLTFTFTPPDAIFKRLIFGDVRYNIRTYEAGRCQENEGYFTDSVSGGSIPTHASLHYFKTSPSLAPSDVQHLRGQGGTPHFYRNDGKQLHDISQVWKTGFGRCESSGSLAPHFRESVPVDCSNTALVPAFAG